ncbi:MAG: hypothetical protein GOMPHAMPRED_002559 [Gomphillus americanus]|uniref:Uncharacterized protein n=1 Tax=Gomphillus americanus TaxID=1940652 RepID=A0A8H3IPB3_9LECA|nr:MAG: hypothetical protein GOMPHAMPRED_002559 [Gomphillus americanus]
MARTRSQTSIHAEQRPPSQKRQSLQAKKRNPTSSTPIKGPGSRIHKRNQNYYLGSARDRTRTVPSHEIDKLRFSKLTIQEVPNIPPKSRAPPRPLKTRRLRAKKVKIRVPPNVPWPLVGVENLGSAGSAAMDISVENSPNQRSGRGQERFMPLPIPLPSPPPLPQLFWAGNADVYDSVGHGTTASPTVILYPVWGYVKPSFGVQGWALKGYVCAPKS